MESLHLTFNLEAGSLLPLAIRCVVNWVIYAATYIENATQVENFYICEWLWTVIYSLFHSADHFFCGLQSLLQLGVSHLICLFLCRGRVKHGRHFTFKSVLGDTAITLVAPTVTGTLVDSEHPYVAHGPWLQVLIPDDLAQVMSDSFEVLNNPEEVSGCCEFLIAVSLVDWYFS